MANPQFITGEFYHIYNRGVERRNIFSDGKDFDRFLESMIVFNTLQPSGSIYEHAFNKSLGKEQKRRLVNIVCYCLNPNHCHFILQQSVDGGVSEFMKRMGGYTKYFNIKYKRSGVLFQGVFKSVHVASNDYFLRLSVYINLNNRVHQLGRETSKYRSSWAEYMGSRVKNLCDKGIILRQFRSVREYKDFAVDVLNDILEKKQLSKELATLLLE